MRYVLNYFLLNVLAPLIPHPKLRSRYLRLLGARIGNDVRIENVRFIQIQYPISNLECGDRAFIGADVILDLSARIAVGARSMVGPRCTLITHQDFGHFNGSILARLYPLKQAGVTIGDDVVIGCDTTVLPGSAVEGLAVIAAKSLVQGRVVGNALSAGSPLRLVVRHPRKLKG